MLSRPFSSILVAAFSLALSLSSLAQPAPSQDEDRSKLRRLDQIDPAPETSRESPDSRPRSRQGVGGDFPFGDHNVPSDRQVGGVVSILGSSTISGQVDSDAVSIGGSTFISRGAQVGGAAVAVLGRLESQGEIHGEAVSVLGGVTINGPVGGEVVSVLGNMELGPNAVIDGDVVVVGGRLIKDPNAIVRGNEVGFSFFDGWGEVDWFTTWVKRCVYYGRPLAFDANLGWAWAIAFSFLAFYMLLALLFSRGVVQCVETLETRPGYSILSSVLTVMLTPVTIVLLAVTIVGALLIPFLGAGLFFATLFGKAVMLAWIGRRFTKFFGDGPLGQPVFAVLIGGLVVLLLYTVPVVGFLSYKLLSWLGLGVVVYTVVLAIKREKLLRTPAPAGISTGVPVASATPYPAAAPSAPIAPIPPTPPDAPTAPSGVVAAPMVGAGFSGASVGVSGSSNVPESGPPPESSGSGQAEPQPPSPMPPSLAAGSALPPPPVTPPPAGSNSNSYGTPPSAAAVAGWPRAGFFIRLGALAIDGVLIGLIMAFISGLLPRFLEFHDGPGGWLMALAIYGALMWKHKGTTIGGIVCGLKVVRVDHREIDWPTAVVRALACFLSLAVGGLGFIWVAIDNDKQSWHDKIAGTAVVVVPKGVGLV